MNSFLFLQILQPMHQTTVEHHLSGHWLSGSPIIPIGLALRVNVSRKLTCLEISDYRISTVPYYCFQSFKSGVVEKVSRWYILQIVTVELRTDRGAYFQGKIQLSGFSAYPDGSQSQLTFNCRLCPHCIYVFCIYLRTNGDLCHIHHKLIGFYNRDEKCLLRGTN